MNFISVVTAFWLVAQPLAGKYHEGQCTRYSLALSAELERRHVPFARIHYVWFDGGKSAMHVLVYFRTEDGQGWLADNESARPYRVSGPLSNARAWITAWGSPFGGPAADIGAVMVFRY